MAGGGRPHVFVDAEPDLLRQLLVTILETVGEDDVTSASDRPELRLGMGFSAALVSAPPQGGNLAGVTVVVLPTPGESAGTVWTGSATVTVDMSAPLAFLEVLDTFCPSERSRTAKAARWGGEASARSPRDGGRDARLDPHAGRVK